MLEACCACSSCATSADTLVGYAISVGALFVLAVYAKGAFFLAVGRAVGPFSRNPRARRAGAYFQGTYAILRRGNWRRLLILGVGVANSKTLAPPGVRLKIKTIVTTLTFVPLMCSAGCSSGRGPVHTFATRFLGTLSVLRR